MKQLMNQVVVDDSERLFIYGRSSTAHTAESIHFDSETGTSSVDQML